MLAKPLLSGVSEQDTESFHGCREGILFYSWCKVTPGHCFLLVLTSSMMQYVQSNTKMCSERLYKYYKLSLFLQVSLNTAYQAKEVDIALKKVRQVLLQGLNLLT